MPRLVSHPDEVKIVSQRFGQGAEKIENYLKLGGYAAAVDLQGEEVFARTTAAPEDWQQAAAAARAFRRPSSGRLCPKTLRSRNTYW